MQYHRYALLLLIAAFTPAHGGENSSGAAPDDGIQALRFTAQFRGRFGQDFDPSQVPKTVALYRLDPGYLLDVNRYSGTSQLVQRVTLMRDELMLDIANWSRVAHVYAKPLARSDLRRGISIVPQETRVATIHPLTYLPGDGYIAGRHLGRRSELQTADRQPAPLVFFDRPCRVSGRIESDREAGDFVQVDLEVPGPGFRLLRYVEHPDHRRSLVISPDVPELVFVTLL